MTDDITIRRETEADHDDIRRVVAAAFGSDVEAHLVDAIRTSADYVAEMALVAEIDGNLVGHVMISGALLRSASGDRRIVMLSPLAVDPDHQRSGIGSALVRAVTAVADDLGEPLIVVEGDPAYYSRFGFEHSTPHGITIPLPGWARPEAAQLMRLKAYEESLRGAVIYPPTFDGI